VGVGRFVTIRRALAGCVRALAGIPRRRLPPSASFPTQSVQSLCGLLSRLRACLPDRPVQEPVRPVCGSRTVRLGPARPVDEPDCPVLGAGHTGMSGRSAYINRSPARLEEENISN